MKMAFILFTPQPDISSVDTVERKIALLNEKIDSLQRDLEYMLTHLDDDNFSLSLIHISEPTRPY